MRRDEIILIPSLSYEKLTYKKHLLSSNEMINSMMWHFCIIGFFGVILLANSILAEEEIAYEEYEGGTIHYIEETYQSKSITFKLFAFQYRALGVAYFTGKLGIVQVNSLYRIFPLMFNLHSNQVAPIEEISDHIEQQELKKKARTQAI